MSPDPELVERSRGGDRGAFAELFERHAPAVRAALISRPAPDADDLVQEAFLIAWREIRQLREAGSFGPWVRRIALRLASRLRAAPGIPEPGRVPAAPAGEAARGEAVRAALASLPESYRAPLWLRYAEGLTGPEVAERLGMGHGSLRVLLHRGTRLLREKLRRLLDDEGG